MDIVFLAVGVAALYAGGELLVHGAAHLARSFGVSALLVGLTVVAVGTSMPEMVTNIAAALQGSGDLAIGNVLGSNVANVGLVLGISGLISTLAVTDPSVRWHIWFMSVVTLVVGLLLYDGELGRAEGLALVIVYALYTVHAYRTSRTSPSLSVADVAGTEPDDVDPVDAGEFNTAAISRPVEIVRIIAGLGILVAGATATVTGAIGIASAIGIPELVIGLTVVAVGTSLPELTASVMSARRGHAELGIGNAVGSNIANLLLVLGATALVQPISTGGEVLRLEFAAVLAFALVLVPMARDRVFSRRESSVLLIGYVAFVVAAVIAGA